VNIALVGSSGFLSKRITEVFEKSANYQLYHIGRQSKDKLYLDLDEAEKFDYEILNEMDYVLFTAAISSPELCEKDFDKAYKINVTGTQYFIERAIKKKCRVLFFSSDAVFGFTDKIVDELSQTCADTAYGKMKKNIEDIFWGNPYFKSMRLSYVISKYDKYSQYLKACLEKKQIAEIYHPFYRNCIVDYEVIDLIKWLIENWITFDSCVLNAGGFELISRVRIADEWNQIYKGKLIYNIIEPEKIFFKYRPFRVQMQSLFLKNILKDYYSPFSEKMKKII